MHIKFIEMKQMKYIGIIPARYASTRFPGKPLALLGGKLVIQRVWEQVSKGLDSVIVATDDERIVDAVESFGGKAVMTSSNHRSGTDRCWEAYVKNGGKEDVVINIQGDEPFIHPSQLSSIMSCFDDSDTDIATLIRPFRGVDYQSLENPNSVKVVVDAQMRAHYFSRSVIPYIRGVERQLWPSRHQYYTHIGLYAYRANVLREITQLPQSSLEIAESLEQLRWLENGYTIKTAISEVQTIGIDTPEDLARAEKELSDHFASLM